MTNSVRKKLLKAMEELGKQHPNWRLGQLVINAAVWAQESSPAELWDLEDEFLLEAIETHLRQRRKTSRRTPASAKSAP